MASPANAFGAINNVAEFDAFINRVQQQLTSDLTPYISVLSPGLSMNPLLNALQVILSNVHNSLYPVQPHPSFVNLFKPRSWRTTTAIVLSLGHVPAVQWASHAWMMDLEFTSAVVQAVETLRFPSIAAEAGARPASMMPAHPPPPIPNSTGDNVPPTGPTVQVTQASIDAMIAAALARATPLQQTNSFTTAASSASQGGYSPSGPPGPLPPGPNSPPYVPPTIPPSNPPLSATLLAMNGKATLPEITWTIGAPLPQDAWRRPAIWTASWRDAASLRRVAAQMENGRGTAAISAAVRSLLTLAAMLLQLERAQGEQFQFADEIFQRTWLPLWSFAMGEMHERQIHASGQKLLPGFVARAAEALEASGGSITEAQAMTCLDQVVKRYRFTGRGRARDPSRGGPRGRRPPSASSRGSSARSGRSSQGSSRSSRGAPSDRRGRNSGGRDRRSVRGAPPSTALPPHS